MSSPSPGPRKRKSAKSSSDVGASPNGNAGTSSGSTFDTPTKKSKSKGTGSTLGLDASPGSMTADTPTKSKTAKSKGKGKAKGEATTTAGAEEHGGDKVKRKSGLTVNLGGLASKLGDEMRELTVKLRPQGDGDYKIIAPGTPLNELDLSDLNPLHKLPHSSRSHAHSSHHAPQTWRSWLFGRKFFFPLGLALGVGLAAIALGGFGPSLPPELLEALSPPGGIKLGGGMPDFGRLWREGVSSLALPAGFDFYELAGNLSVVQKAQEVLATKDFKVGMDLRKEIGLEKKHPVFLIPGIVSTGLESWSTDDASRHFFRKRLWGTTTMVQAILSDKKRWIEALSLDPHTGLDPPKHKVRAAQGLDAASEFITGYWVWQKVVENLAAVGYDTNSMDLASYDWRLAYYNLEIRDAYFSRLKSKIELFVSTNHHKAILVSHSMGASVILYFLKWVEAVPEDDLDGKSFGGGGGPEWVETYIDSWVNIAGTLLGVAKAETAFLSGEMKDTVEINPAGSWVLEKAFSRKERAGLFHSWPGSASMLLKGGNRIWGDQESAPDDPINATDTYGRFLSFRQSNAPGPAAVSTPSSDELNAQTIQPNLTMNEATAYVLAHTPTTFQRMVEANYSMGWESDRKQLEANNRDHRKWSNPLEVQLPKAPSMKIFCLYGHGKDVERSYYYMQGEHEHGSIKTEGDLAQSDADDLPSGNTTLRTPLDLPLTRKNWIDTSVEVKESIPQVRSGVVFGEGDGTVPLLSLGAMCVRGWRDERWNPAGVEVITQEYKHEPEVLDLRGGATTGDHIDILGSFPLNEAVLRIASGRRDTVLEKFVSPIRKYVGRIDWT